MLRNTNTLSLMRAIVIALALSSGCNPSYIREVRRTQTGGEIALTNSDSYSLPFAQEQAKQAMTARCPMGYDVLEEGEVVVGQQTSATTTEQKGGIFTGPSQTTTATTANRNEWHIKYQCKVAPAAPAAPGSAVVAPAAPSVSPGVPQARRSNSNPVYEIVIR
jgi:hypothetical protein